MLYMALIYLDENAAEALPAAEREAVTARYYALADEARTAGDPVALADALERLLGDPARARAMGARGRARVFASGLWSHVGVRLERALGTALGSRGRAA